MDMLIMLNKSNNLWAMFTQSVSNTNPILQNCVDCGVTLFKELSMSKKKKNLNKAWSPIHVPQGAQSNTSTSVSLRPQPYFKWIIPYKLGRIWPLQRFTYCILGSGHVLKSWRERNFFFFLENLARKQLL